MAASGEAASSVAGRVACLFCGHDLLVLPLRTGISQERPPPDSGGSRFLTPPTSCNRRAVGGTAGHSLGKPWPQVCKNCRAGCFQTKGPIVLIYFCAVLAGGPRYTLFLENNAFFSLLPGALRPPGVAYKGPSVGPDPRVVGGRLGGHIHLHTHPPHPPQLPQAAPGAQGPDSRSRPRVGGAGQWAAQAPRGRRSRSGTGPEGISAPGATVWTGSQVFPTQRTGCGPQRGPRTLTCTSCQNKNKFKRDLTHEKALKAQRHISNQRKHDSGKKRGTNWALWELRASVCLRPQGGSPAQAGGTCDTRSEEQPEPVGTLVAHPGVFPAHSEGPVS